jgi:hypothetical protein
VSYLRRRRADARAAAAPGKARHSVPHASLLIDALETDVQNGGASLAAPFPDLTLQMLLTPRALRRRSRVRK